MRADSVIRALRRPLESERRATLPVQIAARWVLLITAVLEVNVIPGTDVLHHVILDVLILGAAISTVALMWQLRSGGRIEAGWVVAAAVYDFLAITGAIVSVDGFVNPNYLLYFPAFVAFALAFPGWPSVICVLSTMVGYTLVVTTSSSFDTSNSTHYKELAVRLATMVSATMMANMIVRIERRLREHAVRTALAAELDRKRVSQEIHDSVAQEIYMLALTLEAVSEVIADRLGDPAVDDRMAALVRLAKQALLETRSVLFNLEPALAGEEGLVALVRGQAAEFSAVTRIPVRVEADGLDPVFDPATTVELYRIVQEALANVYKHAAAARAEVEIRQNARDLSIRLADDGRGFEAAGPQARGNGLGNMRARAEALGGTLALASTPGEGTEITVTVPLGAA